VRDEAWSGRTLSEKAVPSRTRVLMKMYLPPPGRKSSRRSTLKRGLFGGVLLALGGSGFLATRRTVNVDLPPEGLKVLSPQEFAVLWTVAERLIPPHAGFPPVRDLKVALNCDRVLAQVDDTAQKDMKRLLLLLENGLTNAILGRRFDAFTRLSTDAQEQVLDEWMNSRITLRRSGYWALRGLVLAAYYGNPAVWTVAGYAGPPAGIHDAKAAEWRGGGTPRPPSNGQYLDIAQAPAPTDSKPTDTASAKDVAGATLKPADAPAPAP
jgi:hypothetical protein